LRPEQGRLDCALNAPSKAPRPAYGSVYLYESLSQEGVLRVWLRCFLLRQNPPKALHILISSCDPETEVVLQMVPETEIGKATKPRKVSAF
jgi:hypothetical protein